MKISNASLLLLIITFSSLFLFLATASTLNIVEATPTIPQLQNTTKDWPLFLLIAPTKKTESEKIHLSNLINNPNQTTQEWNIIPATQQFDASAMTVLAEARYNNSLYHRGWNFLLTNTTKVGLQDQTSYFSFASHYEQKTAEFFVTGFLEGFLAFEPLDSFQSVSQAWDNAVNYVPQNVSGWFRNHINYMKEQVVLYNATDKRWAMVGSLMQQMEGLAAGFSKAGRENGSWKQASFWDIFAVNWSEMNGVNIHFLGPNYDNNGDFFLRSPQPQEQKQQRAEINLRRKKQKIASPNMESHCSALIRVTSDNVFCSQATWSSFFMLNKMFKTYTFADDSFVQMSSYAGNIASLDDWYVTPHLSSLETSVNVYNYTLYDVFPYTVVSEFLRTMVANYLSTNPVDWAANFAWKNSNTYNNLYLVTALNTIEPKHLATAENGYKPNLPANTVWLVEQIPHHVFAGDVTSHVNEWGFFPGFNSPFFPETRRIAGWDAEVAEYGEGFFSFYHYSRFEIFHRDAPNVTNMSGMQNIMRYNDFRNDPFSRIWNCSGTVPVDGVCDPPYSSSNAIAARGDLMAAGLGPGQLGPLYAGLGQSMTTETDAKIVNWALWKNVSKIGAATVICGPPVSAAHGIPAFRFSTSPWPMPPEAGLPDLIDFKWQMILDGRIDMSEYPASQMDGANQNSDNAPANSPSEAGTNHVIEICFGVALGITCFALIWFYVRNKNSGKSDSNDRIQGNLNNPQHQERKKLLATGDAEDV